MIQEQLAAAAAAPSVVELKDSKVLNFFQCRGMLDLGRK
jgi:hypothetical protein